MYTDDTLVSTLENFGDRNNAKEIEQNINKETYKITTWLHSNKLRLNVSKSKFMILFNPIRSGLFQTVNDPGGGGGGGGALKAPPLRSRKLFGQSSPYHTCELYQVF